MEASHETGDQTSKSIYRDRSHDTEIEQDKTIVSGNLPLNYHPDILEYRLKGTQLAQPFGLSRRVILNNLPPSITLPQLFLGFQNTSAIISAVLVPSTVTFNGKTPSAVLEFCTPEEATAFVNKSPLIYLDATQTKYVSQSVLIPTPSYSHTSTIQELLSTAATRAVSVTGITTDIVQPFLESFNASIVTGAKYQDNVLFIQFSSIIASAAVRKDICRWCMNYRGNEPRRFCDYITLEVFNSPPLGLNSAIDLVPHPFESLKFDIVPDETTTNDDTFESNDARNPSKQEGRPRKRTVDVADVSDSDSGPELESALFPLKNNMARWELYGRVAKHRRTGNCFDVQCPYCRRIQDAPLPALVQQYCMSSTPSYVECDLRMFL